MLQFLLRVLAVTSLWLQMATPGRTSNACFCSPEQYLSLLYEMQTGRQLQGFELMPPFPAPRVFCASQCTLHPACLSFNFFRDSASCQLNSRTGLGMTLTNVSDVDFGLPRVCSEEEEVPCRNMTCPEMGKFMVSMVTETCTLPGCRTEELVLPSTYEWLNSTSEGEQLPPGFQRPRGYILPLQCAKDSLTPSRGPPRVVCGEDGSWKEEEPCRRPASCEDVRACRQDYGEGEYWLYPKPFGGDVKVKVYCRFVNDTASACVTLTGDNRVRYPRDYQKYGGNCFITTETHTGGEVSFQRAGIDTTTMVVNGTDYTFAVLLWGDWRKYGEAHDCVFYTDSCTKRGTMRVDLTSTGLIVDPQQQWIAVGHQPKIESLTRSTDKRVLQAVCGGYCGGCEPEGGSVRLLPDPSYQPQDEEATAVQCGSG